MTACVTILSKKEFYFSLPEPMIAEYQILVFLVPYHKCFYMNSKHYFLAVTILRIINL